MFDRREIEGRYSYKLREAPNVVPKADGVKASKGARIRERRIGEQKRKEEFRKFVEELKRQKVTPEEYRERVMKWRQRANHSEN